MRTNEGLASNQKYVDSIIEQIDHMKELGILKPLDKILDFGCGQGRFANGLFYSNTIVKEYYGFDTDSNSINWCNRFLSSYNPDKSFHFVHLNAFNARYNNRAKGLKKIPLDHKKFNLIFLNSVFSHMLIGDIQFYLKEFHRLLEDDGAIYLTGFVEPDVPDMEENPSQYIADSTGPLHRVRYNQLFFFKKIEEAGFKVEKFFHQKIVRAKQSVLILKKKTEGADCSL